MASKDESAKQTREEKIEAIKDKMRKLDEELEKLKRGEDE